MWHLQTGSCGLGFGVLCGVGVWWLQGCEREREREREREGRDCYCWCEVRLSFHDSS